MIRKLLIYTPEILLTIALLLGGMQVFLLFNIVKVCIACFILGLLSQATLISNAQASRVYYTYISSGVAVAGIVFANLLAVLYFFDKLSTPLIPIEQSAFAFSSTFIGYIVYHFLTQTFKNVTH